MMDWLLDTLLWTAALIAVILLVRRPVARWFGASAAYALWALPLLRLVLPPLTLPAWMAPEEPVAAAQSGEPMTFVLLSDDVSPAALEPAPALFPFTLLESVIAVWLAGAAVFLFLRFRAYRRMREDMLAEARDVGRAGKVRLVETPSTSAPLAFGVIDKVVALPQGFLASWDREARDLALAHELAHHKGHDLLINMAAQPLFALHWFNPLSYLGWLALRRDQEAACDARVIASRNAQERATYAKVIASFAAGPNVALAAPMACPVLGEKSIIQRLRSIKMNNPSAHRLWLGRGAMAAALVAMPLTATVTYADSDTFEEAFEELPVAPAPPTPPAPPAPPMAIQAAAEAPEPPEATAHTHVVIEREFTEETVGEDGTRRIERVIHIDRGDDPEAKKIMRIEMREAKRHAERAREAAELSAERARAGALEADSARATAAKEIAAARAEISRARGEAREAHRLAMIDVRKAKEGTPTIVLECDDDAAIETTDDKEFKTVRLCTAEIMASTVSALEEARASLEKDASIPDDVLKEVLRELEQQIKYLKQQTS